MSFSTLEPNFQIPKFVVSKNRINNIQLYKSCVSKFTPFSNNGLLKMNLVRSKNNDFNTTQIFKSRNDHQESKWLINLNKGLRSYNSASNLSLKDNKNHKRCSSIKSVYLPVIFPILYRII